MKTYIEQNTKLHGCTSEGGYRAGNQLRFERMN